MKFLSYVNLGTNLPNVMAPEIQKIRLNLAQNGPKKSPKSKFSKIGSVLPSIFIRSSQKLKKNQFGVPSGSGNLPKCDF